MLSARQDNTPQAPSRLAISGLGRQWDVPMAPEGMILGQSSSCTVPLADPERHVSRRHARVFRDPAGRWVIEDLDSTNGLWADGRRVKSHVLLPGQKVTIGPYSLWVKVSAPDLAADPYVTMTTDVGPDASDADLVQAGGAHGENLSLGRVRQVNDITDRLAAVGAIERLYPQLCEALSEATDSTALVLRLPLPGRPLPEAPVILACRWPGKEPGPAGQTHPRVHLSRRVLEALRQAEGVVLAASAHVAEPAMDLTITSSGVPRTVVGAVVEKTQESVEAVYLDIPSDWAGADLGDFIHSVARMARVLRRNLVLTAEKARQEGEARQFEMAADILKFFLPRKLEHPRLDAAWRCQPMMWFGGGDYCDVWPLADGRVAFAVGDVTGHGPRGAIVTAALHAAMRLESSSHAQPADVMTRVNQYLQSHLPEEVYVTLVLGFLDPADGRLDYVNAGHPLPLLLARDGSTQPLGVPHNPMLGVLDVPFAGQSALVPEGAGLLLFTDGLIESLSEDDKAFGPEGVAEVVAPLGEATSEQRVEALMAAEARHRAPMGPGDDITVLSLIRLPS